MLDEYERRVREREDAIFEGGDQRALAFLSFVWFFLSELEREQIPLDVDSVQSLLESTLAWQQIPADQRSTFRRMAVAGTRAYARSNPESRRRWARAGTSLRTAIALESIAEAVALIDYDPEVDAPDDLIVRIFAGGRLESLLDLPEAPTIRAFTARGGRRSQIPVPIPELVGSWMQGTSLSDMADRFLGMVQDAEYRFEQLGDLISGLCEAYLPWVLAVIIEWANTRRTESDPPGTPLPSELPAYLRWGVSRPEALTLLYRGIRSRALAHTIIRAWQASDMELEPIEWLKELSLTEWRAQLGVTSSEFTNIFECVRPTRGGLVARVLAGDTFEFAVALEQDVPQPVEVAVHSIGDESPPDLVLVADGNRLGAIPNDRYNDVVTLIATGVQLSFEVRQTPDGGMVRVWMQNLE